MAKPDYKVVKKLKIRLAKGGTLNFAERNIVNMYDREIAKENRKSD